AKATPAAIAPAPFRYGGFVIARTEIPMPPDTWWARIALPGGTGRLFASNASPVEWRDHVRAHVGADVEMAEYLDVPGGHYRVGVFTAGRLDACLFVAP